MPRHLQQRLSDMSTKKNVSELKHFVQLILKLFYIIHIYSADWKLT